MSALWLRRWSASRSLAILGTMAACGVLAPISSVAAQSLWLADNNAWPGVVVHVRDGQPPQEWARRPATMAHGATDSVPRISALAAQGNALWYCSGLDRYIFRYDGRHTLVHTHSAQVRDLAFGSDPNWLYYSVVPTPQNGEPVPEGEIFRVHLRTQQQERVRLVRQADMPGPWWGAFTLHQDAYYLATLGNPSQVVRLGEQGPEAVFSVNLPIRGFRMKAQGGLVFVAGDGRLFESPDLQSHRELLNVAGRKWSGLTFGP